MEYDFGLKFCLSIVRKKDRPKKEISLEWDNEFVNCAHVVMDAKRVP